MVARLSVLTLITAALAFQGCAAPGIPRPLTSGGVATHGVEHSAGGVASRTFNTPMEQLRRATLTTFKRMDLALKSDDAKDERRELVATSGDRTIHVELERITARTTRMRITAKQGWLWRDRAAAGEIIARTERTLASTPAVSERNK
jgi:hypothetical protein